MRFFSFLTLFFVVLSCKKERPRLNAEVTPFEKINTSAFVDLNAIHFFDKSYGITVGDDGYFLKTSNGGENWSQLNCGFATNLETVFMISPTIFYTGKINLLKTSNGGQSFSVISNNSNLRDMFFSDENTGLINTGSLFRTENGGSSFDPVAETVTSRIFRFTSNSIAYASGGYSMGDYSVSDLYKSTDAGKTWKDINPYTSRILAISFINDSLGYFVSQKQDVFKTTNGAETWVKVSSLSIDQIIDLVFINEYNGFLITGNGKIYETRNKGLKWTEEYSGAAPLRKIIKIKGAVIAIGDNGWILRKKL